MKQTIFEVDGLKCRPRNMTPTELLGLESVIETGNADKAAYMYATIFESIEVEILDTWLPLKEKGAEVYNPATIVDEVGKLYRIATEFLTKVLMPLFRKSEESKK